MQVSFWASITFLNSVMGRLLGCQRVAITGTAASMLLHLHGRTSTGEFVCLPLLKAIWVSCVWDPRTPLHRLPCKDGIWSQSDRKSSALVNNRPLGHAMIQPAAILICACSQLRELDAAQ